MWFEYSLLLKLMLFENRVIYKKIMNFFEIKDNI